ncbi:MAG: dTMP kinase [Cyanobacteria bacterium P01_A01_bin.135]
MRGRLIVFEGIEGCGKTTQLRRLQQWLAHSSLWGGSIVATREPGGTPLGQALRQILLATSSEAEPEIHPTTELLLYASDRCQHVMTQLQPELDAGALILCDRYTDSTVAYQGFGRGLERPLIDSLNQIATAGLQSDLTLWLDIEVEQSLSRVRQRGTSDRIEQSGIAFHRRVREGFQHLAEQSPERIVCIEAGGDPDGIAAAIQQVVQQRLRQWQCEATPSP